LKEWGTGKLGKNSNADGAQRTKRTITTGIIVGMEEKVHRSSCPVRPKQTHALFVGGEKKEKKNPPVAREKGVFPETQGKKDVIVPVVT